MNTLIKTNNNKLLTFQYENISDLEEYINKKRNEVGEQTIKTIIFKLLKMDRYEYLLNKSVLDWCLEETGDFLTSVNCRSILSVYSYFLVIKEYAIFLNNKKNDEENVYSIFLTNISVFDENLDYFKKYVNQKKMNNSVITEKNYFDMLGNVNISLFVKIYFICLWNLECKIKDIPLLKEDIVDTKQMTIDNIKISPLENKLLKNFLEAQREGREIYIVDGLSYVPDTTSNLLFRLPAYYVNKNIMSERGRPTSKNSVFARNQVVAHFLRNAGEQINKSELRANSIRRSSAYWKFIKKVGIKKGEGDKATLQAIAEHFQSGVKFFKNELLEYLDAMEEDEMENQK